MRDAVRSIPVVRVSRDGVEDATDQVAVEAPLEVRLHGEPFSVIMRTPGADRDLTVGFLFSESVVVGPNDIARIDEDEEVMSHDDANGRNSGSTFLIGFIAGSMLGAGLALLFAPKPGDETRREVAERAQRVSDKAREGLGSASDRVAQFAERGKAMYQTAAEKAREAAQAVREGRDPNAIIAEADETLS